MTSTASALIFVGGIGLLFAVFVKVCDLALNFRVKSSPRAFTGPLRPDEDGSWFDPVRPYFNRRLDCDERVARAVDHTVYPETDQ